jgi:hypothetical protein
MDWAAWAWVASASSSSGGVKAAETYRRSQRPMMRRRWVRGEWEVDADGVWVSLGTAWSTGLVGRVGATVTATLSGAWVEASDGRGEKASSGMAAVFRVQFEGMDASSR